VKKYTNDDSHIKFSGSVSRRGKGHYQPATAAVVHHSPVRTTKYGQKTKKRLRQSPAKSHDTNDDDVVVLPSTSADVVKRPKLHTTTTSTSQKEQAQQERAERKKKEALVRLCIVFGFEGSGCGFIPCPSHISILIMQGKHMQLTSTYSHPWSLPPPSSSYTN
jgi:hypothetical protein